MWNITYILKRSSCLFRQSRCESVFKMLWCSVHELLCQFRAREFLNSLAHPVHLEIMVPVKTDFESLPQDLQYHGEALEVADDVMTSLNDLNDQNKKFGYITGPVGKETTTPLQQSPCASWTSINNVHQMLSHTYAQSLQKSWVCIIRWWFSQSWSWSGNESEVRALKWLGKYLFFLGNKHYSCQE